LGWGEGVHEEEAGAGDAEPPRAPIMPALPECFVSTNLISLGLGAVLAS